MVGVVVVGVVVVGVVVVGVVVVGVVVVGVVVVGVVVVGVVVVGVVVVSVDDGAGVVIVCQPKRTLTSLFLELLQELQLPTKVTLKERKLEKNTLRKLYYL